MALTLATASLSLNIASSQPNLGIMSSDVMSWYDQGIRLESTELEGVVTPVSEATAAAPVTDATAALKAEFLLSAARAERGFRLSPGSLDSLRQQVEALEAVNPQAAPVDSPLLFGSWELEFCDAADVLSFGALPLELGFIRQDIEQPVDGSSSLQAQNIIEVLPPLSSLAAAAGLPLPRAASTYAIGAECKRLGPTRVGLVFARAQLRPYGLPDGLRLEAGLPQTAVEVLQKFTEDVVYLETTYLDEDLRIARGPSREIYALSRNGAP